MKNRIILLFATTLLFFACDSAAQQKTRQKSKSEGLHLDLRQGEEYVQNSELSSTVVQEINGQEMSMKIKISGVMVFKVLVAHNHYYEMECKFTRMVMNVESPQGSGTFSSESGDDLLSQLFRKVKNKPFGLMIAKTGKVMEVKNAKNIYLLAMDELEIPAATQAQAMQQLEQMFSDEAIKGNIEMVTGIYPEQPAKEGEKWTSSLKVGVGSVATTNVDVNYECTSIDDEEAYISSKATFENLDNETYFNMNGLDMKTNITGSVNAEIIVDRQTGWVKSSKMVQKSSGTIAIKPKSFGESPTILPVSTYTTTFVTDQD